MCRIVLIQKVSPMSRASKNRVRKIRKHTQNRDLEEGGVAIASLPSPAEGEAADEIDILKLLEEAVSLHQNGGIERAEEIYRRVLEYSPQEPNALNLMGTCAAHRKDFEPAADWFLQAIKQDKSRADFHSNLASAYIESGRYPEARHSVEKALKLTPQFADGRYNHGRVLMKFEEYEEAEEEFSLAVKLKPSFFEAHNSLGNVLKSLARFDEAESAFKKAIEVNPSYLEAYNNYGNLLAEIRRLEDASACFRKGLEISPEATDLYLSLGYVHGLLGQEKEAGEYYKKALTLRPKPSTYIRMASRLNVIYQSREEIREARKTLETCVETIVENGVIVKVPIREVGETNFYLAYQAMNDRGLQKKIAEMYTFLPRTYPTRRRPGKKIRIGFISRFFKNHTIGKLNYGFIKNLSRKKFEVTAINAAHHKDDMAKKIARAANHSVTIPENLENAQKAIADLELDILFYTDIGMDFFTYALAFSRLAPVQCTTWGHPVTTGIPNMDYFISSELIEPEGAQDHYSEKLALLKNPMTCYPFPNLPEKFKNRAGLGLPEESHIYLCPQTLFKLHPDIDEIFGGVLRRDPKGIIILIKDKKKNWIKLLEERFAREIPDVAGRIHFINAVSQQDFYSLNATADAILDTLHFSGGNSSLEAFAAGAPIVTLPGEFMRGRVTYGYYQQMGMTDLVAESADAYIDLAVRLATEPDFHQAMSEKIRAHRSVLFNNQETVRQLEAFFCQAVEKVRAGAAE